MSHTRVSRLLLVPFGLFLFGVLAIAQPRLATQREPRAATATPKRAPPPATASAAPTVAFEKFVLPNGLQVILHVDHRLPIVHVNQWYHVGSKNERLGRTGFAHLFEHMMFRGSKHAPGEYITYLERAGANVRENGADATTSQDRTNYFATVSSSNLEHLLWLESDRLATLGATVDKKKLDIERDVVKNERRQGIENQPYGRWYSLVFEAIFPAGHPYSWDVIGSAEDVTAAPVEDVKEFFQRYYTPNNLSLVIAGDIDPAEVRRLVEKYYGDIPPGPALDRATRWIPALAGERILEVADRVPQARTYMAWPAPEFFGVDEPALNLAARILADGLSSRLTKALVYDRSLCSSVSAFPLTAEIAGAFVITADARPGVTLSQIESVITDAIATLAQTGPTAAELERVKTKQEFEYVLGLEKIGPFGGRSERLNEYNTYLGDPGKFDEDLARHRRVTAADVRAAVARWLDTRNRVLVRFHPETSSRPRPTTLDRTTPPPLGADRPFRVPDVQTATLENGLQLFVVERHDLPKIAVTFATRAGSMADPAGKAGLAQMTARTIALGTATRGAMAIETGLGDLGATLNSAVAPQQASLTFQVLSRHLAPALGIVSDVVQHPTFPETELGREKKRQVDALAQQDGNPNAVAARVRAILAFGADHPYGHPAQGTVRSVEAMTREDVAAFHRMYWKPGGSALILVGDITLADATTVARQSFSAWSGGTPPDVAVPAPAPAAAGKIYLIDRQDSAQTVVTQILPAPKRQTEDAYPFRLADGVWGGGGITTRLFMNLRTDKGYSYGVYSTLAQFRHAGYWYAGGGVQTDKTKESLVEFDKELKGLAGATPISQEEFTAARVRRIRGYAQQFQFGARVAGQLTELWAQGLPITELQREYDETDKMTLPPVLAAATKYARPERAMLLLVGDRARIEPGLRELHLGEIVVLDTDGKPIAGGSRPTAPKD